MHALIFTLAALIATALQAGSFGSDCQEFAERSAVQPAAGITRVVIIGRAGFLHIEGRPGATEIRASGRACAAIEELLVGIQLKAARSGSQVTIESFVPKESESFFASAPRLDFTVTLPAGMDVDVADTKGDLTISNTGNTRVAVTGSKLSIRNIAGNLTARDPSGRSQSMSRRRACYRALIFTGADCGLDQPGVLDGETLGLASLHFLEDVSSESVAVSEWKEIPVLRHS